jgi:hypothetical protein
MRRALLACLLLLGTTGCGDLAFRVDDRVSFSAPQDQSTVKLPVTIDWDIRDFDVVAPGSAAPTRDAGYFAVFVDQAPMPPGKTLSWLARDDETCKPSEGCPDEGYLRSAGVFTTTKTELVIEQLTRHSGTSKERHQAVVVLLDTQGRRIGESAFRVVFNVKRVEL